MAGMFYSLQEAAEKLNKTEDEIKQIVMEGKLREFRDGPNLLFKVEEIEALMSETGVPASEEAPEPQSPTPEVSEPEATAPQIPEPEALEPEIPEPAALEPEALEPEIPEPEAPEPEALEPEVLEPEIPEPEAPEPEVLEPEIPEPEAPEPAALEPEISEPEALEPEAPEPAAPELEELSPEAPEPEALEPEAPEPEALEPEIPEEEILAPSEQAAGSSEILLEPETGAPVVPSELTDADTALTGEGISVLGETDSDYQLTDDTLAETTVPTGTAGTAPEVPLEEIEGDINLDSFGSGSGLLDLSLQADDTSLGGILDEIYTAEDEAQELAPAEVLADSAAAVAAEAEQMLAEEQPIVPQPAPEVDALTRAYIEPAPDTQSNTLGMLLFLPLVFTIYTTVVAVSGQRGIMPSILPSSIQGLIWYIMGGAAVVAVLVTGAALMLGGGVAKAAKQPKKPKPKKAPKAKKAKKPKEPKKPKKAKKTK